jgi:hypothetical protein
MVMLICFRGYNYRQYCELVSPLSLLLNRGVGAFHGNLPHVNAQTTGFRYDPQSVQSETDEVTVITELMMTGYSSIGAYTELF